MCLCPSCPAPHRLCISPAASAGGAARASLEAIPRWLRALAAVCPGRCVAHASRSAPRTPNGGQACTSGWGQARARRRLSSRFRRDLRPEAPHMGVSPGAPAGRGRRLGRLRRRRGHVGLLRQPPRVVHDNVSFNLSRQGHARDCARTSLRTRLPCPRRRRFSGHAPRLSPPRACALSPFLVLVQKLSFVHNRPHV